MNLHVDKQVGVPSMESARPLPPDIADQSKLAAACIPTFNHWHTKESRHDEKPAPTKDEALQRRCTRS